MSLSGGAGDTDIGDSVLLSLGLETSTSSGSVNVLTANGRRNGVTGSLSMSTGNTGTGSSSWFALSSGDGGTGSGAAISVMVHLK